MHDWLAVPEDVGVSVELRVVLGDMDCDRVAEAVLDVDGVDDALGL